MYTQYSFKYKDTFNGFLSTKERLEEMQRFQ